METVEKKKGPRLYSRPLGRKRAQGIIHEVVELCRFYIFNQETDPKEKRQWIKTMNGLLSTSNVLLRDVQLDEFDKRLSELEK